MTHTDKIAKVLAKNTKTPGITSSMLAKKTGVPKESVAKRIYDLRNEGMRIYTNYRKVNGVRKAYYRLAS